MIGLILIYFIGNSYYRLAVEHNKNKWVFAILGVATYYAAGFVLGVGLALTFELGSLGTFDDVPSMAWALVEVPVGLACCYGLYKYLKYQWSRPVKTDEQILDADLMK